MSAQIHHCGRRYLDVFSYPARSSRGTEHLGRVSVLGTTGIAMEAARDRAARLVASMTDAPHTKAGKVEWAIAWSGPGDHAGSIETTDAWWTGRDELNPGRKIGIWRLFECSPAYRCPTCIQAIIDGVGMVLAAEDASSNNC